MNKPHIPAKWRKPLLWVVGVAILLLIARATIFAPVVVKTTTLTARDLTARVYGNGTVEAKVVVSVSSKVTGKIQALFADQGDRVKTGQLLARLEDEDFRQQVIQAQAGIKKASSTLDVEEANYLKSLANQELAKSNARRITELGAKNLASKQDVDIQTTALEVARKETQRAMASLQALREDNQAFRAVAAFARSRQKDMLIVAPQDGVVLSRDLEQGATVSPGMPIFRLVDPSVIWVKANVDESKSRGVAVGQEADIFIRSAPGVHFQGRVARIALESDRVTEETEVDVLFDPPLKDFRLGEQAEVYIVTAIKKNTPSLPADCITSKGKKRAVWTVINGELHKKEIVSGIEDKNSFVEVLSGVDPATQVAIAPAEKIMAFKEGMRVKVQK
jgi:HlyD family secretion protein